MTVAPFASPDVDRLQPARRAPAVVRVGLLGLGQIGAAVARLAAARSPARHVDVEVTAALVRDPLRARSAPGEGDGRRRGGVRNPPHRHRRGPRRPRTRADAGPRGARPRHSGRDRQQVSPGPSRSTSSRSGRARRRVATVRGERVAGVPFLGTFARRPYASALTSITGIVNGTTNFILSQMQDGTSDYGSALAEAQRRGFAEPDPSKDVDGIDAAEKLAILIRQFGGPSRRAPDDRDDRHRRRSRPSISRYARALGGTLKPVARAAGLEADRAAVAAFAGPAFRSCRPSARTRAPGGQRPLPARHRRQRALLDGAGRGAGRHRRHDPRRRAGGNGALRHRPTGPATGLHRDWRSHHQRVVRPHHVRGPLPPGADRGPARRARRVDGANPAPTRRRTGIAGDPDLPLQQAQVERGVSALSGCTTRVFRALEPLA